MLLPWHFHVSEAQVFLLEARAKAWEGFAAAAQTGAELWGPSLLSLACLENSGRSAGVAVCALHGAGSPAHGTSAWYIAHLPETLEPVSHFNHCFSLRKIN